MIRDVAEKFMAMLFGFVGGLCFQLGIEGVYWHNENKQGWFIVSVISLITALLFVFSPDRKRVQDQD
jgi:hypothetical protein